MPVSIPLHLPVPDESAPTRADVVHGPWPEFTAPEADTRADHFIRRDGVCFAGSHLIVDLWGARNLDRIDQIDRALRAAVAASGATLLHIHLHHFTPNGGVSGVAVLAESHISVHTWPEREFAAFDIFMCGDARPERSIPVFRRAFGPQRVEVTELRRGEVRD